MSNFKIGDRVRCINATPFENYKTDIPFPIKLGREYVVSNLAVCPRCGDVEVGVGIPNQVMGLCMCECYHLFMARSGEDWMFTSTRFVKVIEKREYKVNVSEVEISEPILN